MPVPTISTDKRLNKEIVYLINMVNEIQDPTIKNILLELLESGQTTYGEKVKNLIFKSDLRRIIERHRPQTKKWFDKYAVINKQNFRKESKEKRWMCCGSYLSENDKCPICNDTYN